MEPLKYRDIVIREAVIKDAPQLVKWWNDGKIMAHAGFPNGLGITTKKVEQQLQIKDKTRLIIEIKGKMVGEMAFYPKDKDVEIGIKICESNYQNQGYGRTILSLLIAYLFEIGYTKIVLDTNLTNLRAQHVYESLGFKKLRVNKDSWHDQLGKAQSSVDYELVAKDFVDYRKGNGK
ncbi:MAG: GNAT family protein [Bacilli bacterium]|jgi:RimJ/RimL family protein N-acetyltransferase|nr:GNAT family protein [Bacilli bacterium]MDD3422722.1 GNAT family protein [Bacilli bacterium]MDD4066220.1 GNAT family protein [Bacilli bacterium]